MASQRLWSWVKRATLLGAAALLVPACTVGGGSNVQGNVANPLWNSTSTVGRPGPGPGLIWNPAGTVILPGQGLTGLDVTYSGADPITYPAQNIPNAKPNPIVQSPYYQEPVTTSGVNDPNGYEDAANQMVANAYTAAYPPNQGGVGVGGGGGLGGGVVVQQRPSFTFNEPRVSGVARGAAFTIRDKGALPAVVPPGYQQNFTGLFLFRLYTAGGNINSIILARGAGGAEWNINGFDTTSITNPDNTPMGIANQLQAIADPAVVMAGLGNGNAIYEGAGLALGINTQANLAWIDLIVLITVTSPPF